MVLEKNVSTNQKDIMTDKKSEINLKNNIKNNIARKILVSYMGNFVFFIGNLNLEFDNIHNIFYNNVT